MGDVLLSGKRRLADNRCKPAIWLLGKGSLMKNGKWARPVLLMAMLALLLVALPLAGCGSAQPASPGGDDSEGPVIEQVTPGNGYAGDEILIRGSDFGDEQGSVAFQGAEAEILSWSDRRITVLIPDTCSSGTVRVSNEAGISNGFRFTVLSTDDT